MNLRNKIYENEEDCGPGMYWCEKSEKCKPEHKRKRKKEQTTAGAAGAYSAPLFGKPMKRKIAEEKLGGTCTCKKCGAQATTIDEAACRYWINTHSETCSGKKQTTNIKIKESKFIELLEKTVYAAIHGGVIKEALTDADERRIGVLARKELKDYEVKLEKKVDQMITKAFKGKDFEDKTLKITKNAIIQLYKALWVRRSFWSEYIKNSPS